MLYPLILKGFFVVSQNGEVEEYLAGNRGLFLNTCSKFNSKINRHSRKENILY